MKSAPQVILFLAGLILGVTAAYVALKKPPAPPPVPVTAEPVAPQLVAVSRLQIEDHDRWAKEGFTEMVPPMKLPTNGAGRDQIKVWLKIPAGGVIQSRKLADGTPSIRFPVGTVADRVESYGSEKSGDSWLWSVADVRGTTLVPDGELFHVYVPMQNVARGPLMGWEWTRGDAEVQRASTTLLVRQLRAVPTMSAAGRLPTPQEHGKLIDSYARNNQCDRCHMANKPEQIDVENAIHRRTDDNGWFVPLAVLSDRMPLESHRPRDQNAGDPFTRVDCPAGEPPAVDEKNSGARRVRCPKGGSPVGVLDVKAGLAAKDARTLGLCASRRYLWQHMDADGRALFADAFRVCGID